MVNNDPSSTTVARRSVLRLLVGSGFVGATWGTGFAALNGNRPPSATIAGDNDWQLTVIESGRSRAAILMGEPDRPVGDTLSRMMGSFRQRIDLVIGTAEALEALPADYRGRWHVQRTVILGGSTARSLAARTGSIARPLLIALGSRLSLLAYPVVEGQWTRASASDSMPDRWLITVRANGATVRLGARLEDIAAMSLDPTAVTVAPRGELQTVWAMDSTTAIAVNNTHVPKDVFSSLDSGDGRPRWLVAVFPNDFTRLAFVEGGIGLPDWARPVSISTPLTTDHSSVSDGLRFDP